MQLAGDESSLWGKVLRREVFSGGVFGERSRLEPSCQIIRQQLCTHANLLN